MILSKVLILPAFIWRFSLRTATLIDPRRHIVKMAKKLNPVPYISYFLTMINPREYFAYYLLQEYRDYFLDSVENLPADCKDFLLGLIDMIPMKVTDGSLVFSDEEGRGFVSENGGANASDRSNETEEEKTKSIYVLLTNSTKIKSRILQFFMFSKYAHSSIALTKDGSFYSFNPGVGFTTERPITQKKKRDTQCVLHQIKVSEETYAEIESHINWFIENPDEYKFNYAGLVFSILHIPFGMENRYFCSQFVCDVLNKSGVTPDAKHPSQYLPPAIDKAIGSPYRTRRGTVEQISNIM